MATTPSIKVLQNGSRVLVLEIQYVYNDAEVSDAVVVDVSAYSATRVVLKKYWANLVGHTATLLWEADADVRALASPEGSSGVDFMELGGPVKNNAGAGITGDIGLTTVGLAAGDHGTIRLELAKVA
jgi:hypothetical protein